MLQNKAGLWKSNDVWKFKPKGDDWIYIENTSKTKVLAITNNNEVIPEDFEEDKEAKQLWKKGELDAEEYFTLKNSEVPKLITAISSSRLKIKGKHNSAVDTWFTNCWLFITLLCYI